MAFATRRRGAGLVFVVSATVVLSLRAQTPPAQTPPAQTPGAAQAPATAPAQGRRGAPPPGRGGGGMGAGPSDLPTVDAEAATRARAVYAAQCINCHGTQARGTDKGANLVRSLVVLRDRYGSELGPFLKKGTSRRHAGDADRRADRRPGQLPPPARQRFAPRLADFPGRQRARPATPRPAQAYFNGEGKCSTCHGAVQQPGRHRRPARRRSTCSSASCFRAPGAAAARAAGPPASAVTRDRHAPVWCSRSPARSCRWTTSTSRCATRRATYRTFRRTPGVKVVKTDPLAAHIALLGTITDKQHARRRRLHGDDEMRRLALLGCPDRRCSDPRSLAGAGTARTRSGRTCSSPARIVADLQRRLHGPALQHARQDQRTATSTR